MNPSSTGIWNGWNEPPNQPDPLDGDTLIECPHCGRQPHYTRNVDSGYSHILRCGCGELETVPCRTLDGVAEDWNEMAEMEGMRMAEEKRRLADASAYLKLAKLTHKLQPTHRAQIRRYLAKARELRTA